MTYGILIDFGGEETRRIFRPACCNESNVYEYVHNITCMGECTVTVFGLEMTGQYVEVFKL